MNLLDPTFTNILQIIKDSRENALRQVNTQLIIMYMSIGKVLSEQTKVASYGDDYMNRLSDYIQSQFPGIKGFTRRSLYRMKQFYEAYHTNEQLSDLIPKLSWSSHILILSSCKTEEEREFYLRLSVKENYSKRQLERQIDTGYYERFMLSKGNLLPEPVKSKQSPFLDSYVIEFLNLPETFHENDFRKALVSNMKNFILELGGDFTFVGEEYPIQVGGEDYRIDLLFFHPLGDTIVCDELVKAIEGVTTNGKTKLQQG